MIEPGCIDMQHGRLTQLRRRPTTGSRASHLDAACTAVPSRPHRHARIATSTAPMISSTVICPSPSRSPAGHDNGDVGAKAAFTSVSSSSTVTSRSRLQSPRHAGCNGGHCDQHGNQGRRAEKHPRHSRHCASHCGCPSNRGRIRRLLTRRTRPRSKGVLDSPARREYKRPAIRSPTRAKREGGAIPPLPRNCEGGRTPQEPLSGGR
jgi:hypothetical protein